MRLGIGSLGKRYGDSTWGVRGIDLELDAGVRGLLGPNGAGKSTLTRMVTTTTEPTVGLDPKERVRMRNALADTADTVAVLEAGRLVTHDEPQQPATDPDAVFRVNRRSLLLRAPGLTPLFLFVPPSLLVVFVVALVGLLGGLQAGLVADVLEVISHTVSATDLRSGRRSALCRGSDPHCFDHRDT